jgi:pimeloyl-ACP methyl ester carboxylesterase
MTHLNWDAAHILGHSWTGKLATIWAQQNPQKFLSMMLVDPIFITKMPSFLKLTFPILYHTLETLKGMGPFSTYEEAESQAKLLKKYANWNELQRLIFQESIESKPDQTWGSKFTKPARDQIFDQVVEVAGLTQDVNIPTLFIQPEKGVNRLDWQIKPYQKYLSNLTIKKVPGNHWAFLGDAETFNQAIGEFLTNLSGRRGAQTT